MRSELPSAGVDAVRRLPSTQRRRAALVSIAGHGALIALLTLIGTRTELPSIEPGLILGELVTASREPVATPAEPPAGPVAERAEEPPPAPAEAPAAEPSPPVVELQRERQAEPESTAPQERPAEPPAESEPDEERLAELPPADVEPVAELPQAPEPSVAEGLPAADAPAVATEEPARALASHEQRAVRRRLSSWTGHLGAEAPGTTLAWRDAGQDYTAVLKHVPAADAMGMEQLLVELTTQRDGQRLMTELRMNRIAFSNFAQFIDRWDPEVQIHDDLIDGRFHSNSEIRVSREDGVQPVFNGKVTVAAGDVRSDGTGFMNRRAMFPGGIETRVRRIVLPARAAAFDEGDVPADRVRRIVRDSLLTFHADGTFESRAIEDGATADAAAAIERGALGDEPFYIVADDGVDLHVRGTVNGKVLVYSPARIVIVDDVRYFADPREQDADDYLGLVAERTVEIDEPEVTGPGDLTIHASIYARTRFAVRDYRSRRSGTLVIHGSVTAGSVSATEPRFATRIEFDDRLTTMRAPGFPLSDRYELDSASGAWRVVDTP
jgi:outer membrane biosynthesis protein TonB